MSHDVQIQYEKNELRNISVENAQSALSAVGFIEVSPLCWVAEKPHTEVHLSVISETGDSVTFDQANLPKDINRIDTHVPWNDYAWGFRSAHHRRTALARILNWVAYDLQTGQLIASPVDGAISLLDPANALDLKAKSTIEMISVQKEILTHGRPKGKIVAKENHDGRCRWLEKTEDGWLIGLGSGRVGGNREHVLQFRDESFKLLDEIERVGSIGALSPDGKKLIVQGMTCGGYNCRSALVDIQKREIVSFLPFTQPYIWHNNDVFFAIPSSDKYWDDVVTCTTHPVSIPFLLTKECKTAAAQNEGLLYSVDLKRNEIKCVQDEHLFYSFGRGYPFYRDVVLGRSSGIVFLASTTSVGALDVKTSQFRWQRELGRYSKEYFHVVNEIALSPCGSMLAVASGGESRMHPNECVVLNSKDGEVVMATAASPNSKVKTVDWHSSGWLACGLSNGEVVFIDLNGSRREFKGSLKGINSVRIHQQTLIVAGTEKNVRIFPLLPDEAGEV